MKESLPKALMSGVTYAAGSAMLFPDDLNAVVNLPLINVPVPFLGMLFAGGVIGSISGDLAASMLYPMIPAEQRIKDGTIALADASISGLVSSAFLGPAARIPVGNMPKLFAYSTAHNMANEYLWANVISDKGFKIL